MIDLGKFITVNEAANRLNVTKHVIYRLIETNAIKGFKPGGLTSAWKIDENSLNDYVLNLLDDSPFVSFLQKCFNRSSKKEQYIRLLILRYGRDYTIEQTANNLNISDTTYRQWEITALNYIKKKLFTLSFENIKDDRFALRIIAKIILHKGKK